MKHNLDAEFTEAVQTNDLPILRSRKEHAITQIMYRNPT